LTGATLARRNLDPDLRILNDLAPKAYWEAYTSIPAVRYLENVTFLDTATRR
jgi:hypothetical protein